jgi:BMFP domain-containing protein YqiC
MESSQSLKILLDMLREDLKAKLTAGIGKAPTANVENTISNAIEALRENLLDKFELVAKAEYEAQIALLENIQAQLQHLEARLEALEQDPTS